MHIKLQDCKTITSQLAFPVYAFDKVIVKLGLKQTGIHQGYGAYNQIKWHFAIPIFGAFQRMSLSNIFLISFFKFLAISFGCCS